jgi:predicted ATPase
MSIEDTQRFLAFVAYLMATLSLLLIGYLLLRKLRRHRRRHRQIRPRAQQHRDTWGWS